MQAARSSLPGLPSGVHLQTSKAESRGRLCIPCKAKSSSGCPCCCMRLLLHAHVSTPCCPKQADLDYGPLRDALQQGEFEKADDITRANLIQLAGPDAQKRGWVYFSEVHFIAAADLQTMDTLWRAASNQRWATDVIRLSSRCSLPDWTWRRAEDIALLASALTKGAQVSCMLCRMCNTADHCFPGGLYSNCGCSVSRSEFCL